MNPETGPGNQRQAALALHAMDDADREWMLARLAVSQRAIVAPLLAELHALGIPRQAVGLPPAGAPDGARLVDGTRMARALSGEPRKLVAHLLQHDWAGRLVLQEALEAGTRERLRDECAALPAAPALKRALREEMERLPPAAQSARRGAKALHRRLLGMLGRTSP